MATLPLRSTRNAALHGTRAFGRLPDPDKCQALLAELAAGPCPFGPVTADRPLALYGVGNLGRLAREFLKAVGHDFVVVIDRNARGITGDATWSDARLLHPDEVPPSTKEHVRVAVSVAIAPYAPIERALLDQGFPDVVPFYDLAESFRHLHPLSNGWFAPPLTTQDKDNTATVLAGWSDDVSRAHHLQFLAWRRLREEWSFDDAAVTTGDRFFIPEVVDVLHNRESFLDAGAYHGTVTADFVKRTGGLFRQIVAIEPDRFSLAKLERQLASLLHNDPGVTLLNCALADGEHEATFHHGLGYASQLSDTGTMRVTTKAIDGLDLAPSFVKLHLEGGELDALKGARDTLTSCRPIVTATVYHNADGIWHTPLWLMELLPEYRFLFRVHSWCGTGAVVYAIPNERTRH